MFFLVQKTRGISSFGAIAHLRKKFGIKKIGHTGTLDPLATGLLLVATENSTKLIPYIDKAKKTYIFTLRMDGSTASGDLDTPIQYIDEQILSLKKDTLKREDIEQILSLHFSGIITQVPPTYSALRIEGKRAYEHAREGNIITIPERQVEIFSHHIISYNFPELTLEMEVSVGTYIRSIAEDLARHVGLSAYVTVLHRSKIAHLSEEFVKKFDDVDIYDALPYEKLFPDFLIIEPSEQICEELRNGLKMPNILDLIPGRKYLVRENGIYISLIEVRDDEIRICANNIS